MKNSKKQTHNLSFDDIVLDPENDLKYSVTLASGDDKNFLGTRKYQAVKEKGKDKYVVLEIKPENHAYSCVALRGNSQPPFEIGLALYRNLFVEETCCIKLKMTKKYDSTFDKYEDTFFCKCLVNATAITEERIPVITNYPRGYVQDCTTVVKTQSNDILCYIHILKGNFPKKTQRNVTYGLWTVQEIMGYQRMISEEKKHLTDKAKVLTSRSHPDICIKPYDISIDLLFHNSSQFQYKPDKDSKLREEPFSKTLATKYTLTEEETLLADKTRPEQRAQVPESLLDDALADVVDDEVDNQVHDDEEHASSPEKISKGSKSKDCKDTKKKTKVTKLKSTVLAEEDHANNEDDEEDDDKKGKKQKDKNKDKHNNKNKAKKRDLEEEKKDGEETQEEKDQNGEGKEDDEEPDKSQAKSKKQREEKGNNKSKQKDKKGKDFEEEEEEWEEEDEEKYQDEELDTSQTKSIKGKRVKDNTKDKKEKKNNAKKKDKKDIVIEEEEDVHEQDTSQTKSMKGKKEKDKNLKNKQEDKNNAKKRDKKHKVVEEDEEDEEVEEEGQEEDDDDEQEEYDDGADDEEEQYEPESPHNQELLPPQRKYNKKKKKDLFILWRTPVSKTASKDASNHRLVEEEHKASHKRQPEYDLEDELAKRSHLSKPYQTITLPTSISLEERQKQLDDYIVKLQNSPLFPHRPYMQKMLAHCIKVNKEALEFAKKASTITLEPSVNFLSSLQPLSASEFAQNSQTLIKSVEASLKDYCKVMNENSLNSAAQAKAFDEKVRGIARTAADKIKDIITKKLA